MQALAGPSAGPSGGQIYIDGFTGGTLPSKDSIREIRINQNPFSPEYDKLGYGRIEILTKPGTDKLHGNVNADFGDAIWMRAIPTPPQKAPFLQRNFGGSLSGALGKKASFFLDVQDRDIDNGNIINGFQRRPDHPSGHAFQQRLLSSAKPLSHQPAHRLPAQHRTIR